MAGNTEIIDSVVSKQALTDLDNLNEKLVKSYEAMELLLGKVQNLEIEYGKYGKSLSEINNLAKETNKVIKEKEELDKKELKLLQEREKLVQQTLRTEREKQKTDRETIKTREAEAKAAERQAKADKKAEDAMLSQEGSINKMRQSMAGLVIEYNRADEATRARLAPAIRELQERINAANAEIGRSQGYVGQYARALAGVGMRLMGALGLIGGLSMLAKVARETYKTVVDFEQANVNLSTILGKNVKNIKALTDSAKMLGSTTEWMASQVTLLQTELAKLGFTERQIFVMQKSILQFATATGAELPEAAKLAGAALGSFGMDAIETERAVGVMTVGTYKSALSFEYLDTAMSKLAPVAKAYGFTIEDMVSLLGTLANAGFDASSAATAAKNILLNLANANGKLAKELGKPVKTIPELAAALKKLKASGVDLADTLDLTDKRSVAAFNTFMEGTDTLVGLRKELENIDGELERIQEERLNTVEGSVKLLQSSWESLMLSFSGSTGVMKSVIDRLTSLLDVLRLLVSTTSQTGKAEMNKKIIDAESQKGTSAKKERELVEQEVQTLIDAGKSKNKALEIVKEQRVKILEEQKEQIMNYLEGAEAELKKKEADLGNVENTFDDYFKLPKNRTVGLAEQDIVHQYILIGEEKANLIKIQARIDELLGDRTTKPVGTDKNKDAKDLAENLKTLGLIETFRLKKNAEINRQIAKNDKETYDARRAAAEAAAKDDISALEKQRDAEIAAVNAQEKAGETSAKTAANQRILISEKAAYEIVQIEQKRAKEISDIDLAEAKEKIKTAKDAIDAQNKLLNEGMQNELVAAAKSYEEQIKQHANNEEKRKKITEEYQKQRLDIIRKYNQQAFESEMESLESMLNALGLTEEQKADICKKMNDLRAKNAKEIAEYEIETAEDRADKIISIEDELNKILNDKRVKLSKEIWDTMLEVMNTYYDSELDRIDEREKREQEYWDDKLKTIEENVEAGLMAEETADAQRRIIEESQAQREKEYERQRKDVQRKQSVWQKADAIMKATVNTAVAFTSALGLFPPPLGIAMAAIVAALGAAQIATIVSQPVPSYAKGTKDHPGGWARVGDGGRPEMVVLPSGEIWKTPPVDTLACLPQGTEVLPDFKQAVMNICSRQNLNCGDDRRGDTIFCDDVLRKNTREASVHLASLNRNMGAIRANSVYSDRKAVLMYRLNKRMRHGIN